METGRFHNHRMLLDGFAGAGAGGRAAQETGAGSKDERISTPFHVLSVSCMPLLTAVI